MQQLRGMDKVEGKQLQVLRNNSITDNVRLNTKGRRVNLCALLCVELIRYAPRAALRSASAVVMGPILKFSTRKLSTFGVMNAGSVGPSFIFFIPRCRSERSMTTAFCSYHESMKDNGRSFTPQLKAPASATAICTAEYASLHWPISSRRVIPPISPNSSLLKRYLPQASVRMTQSAGTCSANSV